MIKILSVLMATLLISTATLSANPTTYTIESHSSYNLGSVSVNGSSCSASANIPSAGSYSVSVGCSISSITIAGQTVVDPATGPVTLPSGKQVSVSWTSSSLIEIWDIIQTNAPVRH